MRSLRVDVLVVGGGPGGLYAAERLARRGVHVLVCEEHLTIGEPVHCTGVLAAESFDELDLPHQSALNPLTIARFESPSGVAGTYSKPVAQATVINRASFDAILARRAAAAGAEFKTGVRVSALEIDSHGARGFVGDDWVRAELVILACGANYMLQRRLGLGLP